MPKSTRRRDYAASPAQPLAVRARAQYMADAAAVATQVGRSVLQQALRFSPNVNRDTVRNFVVAETASENKTPDVARRTHTNVRSPRVSQTESSMITPPQRNSASANVRNTPGAPEFGRLGTKRKLPARSASPETLTLRPEDIRAELENRIASTTDPREKQLLQKKLEKRKDFPSSSRSTPPSTPSGDLLREILRLSTSQGRRQSSSSSSSTGSTPGSSSLSSSSNQQMTADNNPDLAPDPTQPNPEMTAASMSPNPEATSASMPPNPEATSASTSPNLENIEEKYGGNGNDPPRKRDYRVPPGNRPDRPSAPPEDPPGDPPRNPNGGGGGGGGGGDPGDDGDPGGGGLFNDPAADIDPLGYYRWEAVNSLKNYLYGEGDEGDPGEGDPSEGDAGDVSMDGSENPSESGYSDRRELELHEVNKPYLNLPRDINTFAANNAFRQQIARPDMYGNSGIGTMSEKFYDIYDRYNFPYSFSERIGTKAAKRLRRNMLGRPMLAPSAYMSGGLAILPYGLQPPVYEGANSRNQIALMHKDYKSFMQYAAIQF